MCIYTECPGHLFDLQQILLTGILTDEMKLVMCNAEKTLKMAKNMAIMRNPNTIIHKAIQLTQDNGK